jgi:flagellar export protein FliJ
VKRFVFSLEKARKLRAYAEAEAASAAGRAAMALRDAQARLEAIEQAAFSARATRPAEGADVAAEMLNYQRYAERLRAEKADCEEAVAAAAARAEEARRAWAEAKGELAVLENLKERQAAEPRATRNEYLAMSNEGGKSPPSLRSLTSSPLPPSLGALPLRPRLSRVFAPFAVSSFHHPRNSRTLPIAHC